MFAPFKNQLSKNKIISLNDLKNEPLIICNPLNAPLATASFQNQLLGQHSGRKILYCDSIEVAHCMVSASMGITILPKILCMKSSDFAYLPFDDSTELSFGVFYHQTNSDKALKNFLRLI